MSRYPWRRNVRDLDTFQIECQSIADNTEQLFTEMDRDGESSVWVYLQNIEAHLSLLSKKIGQLKERTDAINSNDVRNKPRIQYLREHIEGLENKKIHLYRLFEARKRRLLTPSERRLHGITMDEVEQHIRATRWNITQLKKNNEKVEDIRQQLSALRKMVQDDIMDEGEILMGLDQIENNTDRARKIVRCGHMHVFLRHFGLWIIAGCLVLIDICVVVIRVVRK